MLFSFPFLPFPALPFPSRAGADRAGPGRARAARAGGGGAGGPPPPRRRVSLAVGLIGGWKETVTMDCMRYSTARVSGGQR